jgi:hypothetical protein
MWRHGLHAIGSPLSTGHSCESPIASPSICGVIDFKTCGFPEASAVSSPTETVNRSLTRSINVALLESANLSSHTTALAETISNHLSC